MARTAERHDGWAMLLAVASAVGTSTSGPLAKALVEGGWSPVGVALARAALAALVLLVPGLLVLRGRWLAARAAQRGVVVLGAFGIAGLVVCYFNAVMRLPVGVAMMIQYTSPTLVLGWTSWRQRRMPSGPTSLGALIAMAGLVMVVGLASDTGASLAGVLWACGGAACLAIYFTVADSLSGLPPVGLAWLSLVVATLVTAAVAAVGLMPLRWTSNEVTLAGRDTSWLVPLLLLTLVATVFAYIASMASVGVLGARLASFVSLSELVSAILIAWVVLGEVPKPVQLLGGLLIGVGVVLVRSESTIGGLHASPTSR
ncbi:MAG: DMT family transporter [Nocardioidaceae bacterium]